MTRPARIRENPEVRRLAILDQAISLIAERGYDGLTIQELARRSDLSNAGLLHHFPSKPEILLAVLRELEARESEVMAPLVQAAIQAPPTDQSRAAVRDVLLTIVARCSTKPEITRAFAEILGESLDSSHPAHAWWRKRETQMNDLFVLMLSPYIEEPTPVARQLIAMIDGLILQWLRVDQGFDLPAEWERALARLLPELN